MSPDGGLLGAIAITVLGAVLAYIGPKRSAGQNVAPQPEPRPQPMTPTDLAALAALVDELVRLSRGQSQRQRRMQEAIERLEEYSLSGAALERSLHLIEKSMEELHEEHEVTQTILRSVKRKVDESVA